MMEATNAYETEAGPEIPRGGAQRLRRRRRRGLAILLAFVAACGPSGSDGEAGGVALAVEPEAAQPGDSVELLLRNESGEAIGYNLCTTRLERGENGEWVRLPPDRVCTRELRTLAPGEVARYPVALAADLDPGSYRFLAMNAKLEARSRDSVATDTIRLVP